MGYRGWGEHDGLQERGSSLITACLGIVVSGDRKGGRRGGGLPSGLARSGRAIHPSIHRIALRRDRLTLIWASFLCPRSKG